jgi:jumonji domain-containing protein 2
MPGINTSYIYYGNNASSFGLHYEDMYLFSTSFLHFGASKIWYVIAPSELKKLETFLRSHLPENQQSCDAFLMHKEIMVNPKILEKEGIRYTKFVCKFINIKTVIMCF